MFAKMSIEETRSACKEKIEALEFALRRLIDQKLTIAYGSDYFNKNDVRGEPIFSNSIKSRTASRIKENPGRYQRRIDALLLEEEARTICKFFSEFKDALSGAAHNREAAKKQFDKLIEARNPLYHANPISLRQAEQVFCYSNEMLDSIQEYYSKQSMKYEFNAPLIIRMSDSLGNVRHRSAGTELQDFRLHLAGAKNQALKVGDTLTVEIEVDSAYSADSYSISWVSTRVNHGQATKGPSFQVVLTEKHVGSHFDVQCHVVSNNTWHRRGHWDDFMIISYKVLPVA